MDVSLLTDFGADAAIAVAAAGALYVTTLVLTQAFPFIGAWIKKVRGSAQGR